MFSQIVYNKKRNGFTTHCAFRKRLPVAYFVHTELSSMNAYRILQYPIRFHTYNIMSACYLCGGFAFYEENYHVKRTLISRTV
jgi:hypothetical protein